MKTIMKTSVILKIFIFCFFSLISFHFLPIINSYAGDIGFVDMNRIILEAQDSLDVRDLLKLEEERYEIRFEKKRNLLKSKIDGALQGRHKTDDYKEYQMELDEIKDNYQHMENLIGLREIELTHGLLKKIIDAIKDAANKKGYRYVFELTESKIFFQDNKDDITDDVIAEMDKTHYDVRLLEDLKTKKGMYLRPDGQRMWKRELAEVEGMIVSLSKRHKEDKKDVSLEEGKKETDKPPKPVPEGLNRGIEYKAVKEEKEDIKKLQSAIIPETKPILKKEGIKAPNWEKEIKENEPIKGGVSTRVVIKSKLLAQPVYSSNVLDEIEADGEVTILKSLASYWYYVQTFDGKRGYLFATAFDRFVTGYEIVFIKGKNIGIRNKTSNEVLGKVTNEHALLLEDAGGELVKIAAPCCTGYVRKKFVNKKE
ncbi:MAG: OmpH family outer membrane protein [Deltaproteobacteria bacterium]|nr:OmpH family outer membrane protein [Deltaproteobacteria bacterium]